MSLVRVLSRRFLWIVTTLTLLTVSPLAWAGTVTITSPANNSSATNPVHIHATYSATAKYMKLWVNGASQTGWTQYSSTFDAYITLPTGTVRLVVQAADSSTGTVYSSSPVYVTVSNSTTNTITVSPSSATVTEGTTQQFTATDSGGLAVTWSASCGTITSSGMFTAPNATGTCTITASDSTGAKGTATATIQAPSSSPQVTITSPVNNSTVPNPVHVHATYNGSASYMKLWVDHVDVNQIQYNTSTYDVYVTLAAGAHLLEVQAADATTGTVYTSAVNITVSSSTTVTVSPSSATLAPGKTQQFTANVPVTWSATGDGTINSSGLFTAGSTTGSATVTATATDGSGATGTASVTVSSSTTPTVTFVTPLANATVTSPVEVKFTYNGTASYMKLWVDGVAQTAQHNPNTYDIVISLATGKHKLSGQAHDSTSGITYTTNEYITVGTSGTTVTITPSTATLGVNATQQFTANVPVTWSAIGDGTINSSGLFTAGSTAGNATVTGTATDGSGATGTASVTVSSGTVVTVSPSTASTQVGGTQQFSANVAVTWTASCGTINSSGLFTAPGTTGTCTITATATDGSGATGTATDTVVSAPPPATGNYTTWKNDNLRTGQQRNETTLTPSNVNSTTFGILFSESVDAAIYAQPLYMSGLTINGATHNVVFIATENDSVYAFDADTAGSYLWKTNLLNGGVPIPQANVGSTIYGGIGITSTPVIDPSTDTIYVVTEDLENSTNYVFRLHALDVTTGKEKFGGPVVVSDPAFQPKEQLQRSALLLANGNVYFAFASQGDHSPWHGWLFAYTAGSLQKVAAYNSTSASSSNGGGIWGGGNAIAADANGNIFAGTGNGSWNGTTDLSMSYIKFSSNLSVLDYFSPYNEQSLSNSDGDLGSGGFLLVPDQSGTYPHELIGCGKPTPIYVVNRDDMGHLQPGVATNDIQELPNVVGGTTGTQASDHCFMSPAFWQQNLYFIGNNDVIKQFTLNGSTGKLSTSPVAQGTFEFVFPGAQPVVSSNGSSNGIVWAMDHAASPNSALHAFDATNVSHTLYTSPALGNGTKWAVPTVINGKVYVGINGKFYVFGLK